MAQQPTKMIISAIAAHSKNRVIGDGNQIPWYLPADLAYFKRTTLGHCVLMGRKTFLSLGRPLPKRHNIVITRDAYFAADGVLVANSIEDALTQAYELGEEEAFIIGGGEIYKQTIERCDRLYLTEVDLEIEGETVFPEMDEMEWRMVWEDPHLPDEKNPYAYTFRLFERVGMEELERPGPSTDA